MLSNCNSSCRSDDRSFLTGDRTIAPQLGARDLEMLDLGGPRRSLRLYARKLLVARKLHRLQASDVVKAECVA